MLNGRGKTFEGAGAGTRCAGLTGVAGGGGAEIASRRLVDVLADDEDEFAGGGELLDVGGAGAGDER